MSRLIASLGMYDHPAQRTANDMLWAALSTRLRARGIDAPDRLDRSRSVEAIWRDPNLLFAQTCGYPLVSDTDLSLQIVGIPVYDAPDCQDGRHVSYLIVRTSDGSGDIAAYENRRAAINARMSNSGHNLFRALVAPLATDGRYFGDVVETGSHRASVDAVRTGRADIAAIDAITFAALRRFEPEAVEGLRILAVTSESPTLPFVTAGTTDPQTTLALRETLADVLADERVKTARQALFLKGVVPADRALFETVRRLETEAISAGYPVLR